MSKGRTEPVTRENGAPLHEALGYERRGYWFPHGALMLATWTEGFDGEWDFDPVDGTETFEPETVEALRVLLNERHAARATPAVVPRPCIGKHDPALVCPYCVCPSCGLDGKEHKPGCAAVVPLSGAGACYVDSKPPASDETKSCGGCGEGSAPWEGWQRPDLGKCWWTWDCEDQVWLFLCKSDRATAGTGAGGK